MAANPTRFTLSAEDLLAFENLKPRVDELCAHELALEARIKALEEGLLVRTAAPSEQQIDRRARVGLAIEKLMLHFDPAFKGHTVRYGERGYNIVAGDAIVETEISVVTLLERAAKLAESAGTKQVSRQQPKPLEYPDF